MKFEVFCDWHRWQYVLQGLPRDWTVHNRNLAPKLMFWNSPTTQVIWEYHDGVPDGEIESTERLEIAIKAADKSKKLFYIKPNLSPAGSCNFFDLATSHSVTLASTYPWSYYAPMAYILKHRWELRKNREQGIEDLFAGSFWKPGRKEWCDSVSNRYYRLENAGPDQLVSHMLKARRTLQPLGIGPRHNIYESMALGVEFIAEQNAYMKPDIVTAANNGQALIEIFETKMLPQQIVQQALVSLG